MKTNIIIIIIIILPKIIYSQIQDTLLFKDNSNFSNISLNLDVSSYDNIKLIEDNKFFDGYLVIQLDSTTYSDKYFPIFRTPMFFIESIDSLQNEKDKIFFWYHLITLVTGDECYHLLPVYFLI